jgi:hypothetical protein
MRLRTIFLGISVVALSFVGATVGFGLLSGVSSHPPALAPTPPLPPITRSSVIVAPTVIPLNVIREGMETRAPRDFSGKRDNPLSKLLSDAEIGWTAVRGPLTVSGRPQALTISTTINGALRATGKLSTQAAGGLGNVLGNFIGDDFGRGIQKLAGRAFDQRADVRGNITVTSRPTLTPNWRLQPNLATQVAIADGGLSIAGVKLSVANEVKPLLDRSVADQVNALQAHLSNDPFIEQAVRREWTKLCRSVPLGGGATGLPKLWLEIRPTRAFAAQPHIDAAAVTLTAGVEAETRIVSQATKPNCPFPAKLEIVPALEQGRIKVGMPIDLPLTDVNRLIEARLAGKTFTSSSHSLFALKVRHAKVAASGDRLLISLDINASEQQSWFKFGGDATVYVWGKPKLDREQQTLRLTDISLDVQSEGILGTAARAAMPYLQDALADYAVIDLKPFIADARKNIDAAMADFRKTGEGVRVDAAITDLRLADVAFDSKTLRVVVEANGAAKATVTALPGMAKP